MLRLIYRPANAKFSRSCQLWLHISIRYRQLLSSWLTFPYGWDHSAIFAVLHAFGGLMLIKVPLLLGPIYTTTIRISIYCSVSQKLYIPADFIINNFFSTESENFKLKFYTPFLCSYLRKITEFYSKFICCLLCQSYAILNVNIL